RANGLPRLRAVQALGGRRGRARAAPRPAGRRRPRRRPCGRAAQARVPHTRRDPRRHHPAAVPRPDVVVLDRRGGQAPAGHRHPGRHRHERPALALLRADAPREPARRAPLRPPARGPDPCRARPAAGQEQLVPDHARVGLRRRSADRAGPARGGVRRGPPVIAPASGATVPGPPGAGDPRPRARARVAALALLVAGAFVVVSTSLTLSAEGVRDHVDGYGAAGPLVFIAVSSVLTVALFPGPLLAGASGLLFGTALGTPVSIVSATLGATLAFSLARWIARDAVEEVAPPRVRRLRAWIGRRGFLAVLYARLAPGLPYSLVNYAAGLAPIAL